MIERLSSHSKEHVGLVFVMIQPAAESFGLRDRVDADACIVPGGDKVCPDSFGILSQLAELEPVVTAHAGIGRPAAVVFGDEVIDDLREVLLEVQDIERNAQCGRDSTSIGRVENRAAALFIRASLRGGGAFGLLMGLNSIGRSQSHENAQDLISLAKEQCRGDGAIDAAGHREHDFFARHSHG